VQSALQDVFVKVSYSCFDAVWVLAGHEAAYVWDLAWLGVRKTHDDQGATAFRGASHHAELSPGGEPDVLVPALDQTQSRR